MNTPRYFEDLTVGDRRTAGPVELTEAESIAFATRYDPQPMHIDPVFALEGPFHGLIASGWQTASLVMRLIIQMKLMGSSLVLGMGVDELRWPVPVRPGDLLTAELEVIALTPSKSKPDFGVVRVHVTGRNQQDQVVLTLTSAWWIPRRPKQ
jgi:acyl dehydratase